MSGTPLTADLFSQVDGRLSSTTLKKLEKAGITTMEALAVSTPKELIDLTSMGKETAEKAVRLAQEIVSPGFITAHELHLTRGVEPRCTTGSKELDRILGGGIEAGSITELIGEFAGGKTQICFTLSVTAQRGLEEQGFDRKVVYIDTENTFVPERIIQIAKARGYEEDEILKNIIWARAYNTKHQLTLIQALYQICQENDVGLVIVDSMIAHLRDEYLGRSLLPERQGMLGKMLGILLRVAEANKAAIVITNQVQAKPTVAYGDPNRPAGGHIMAHACTYRVRLRKGRTTKQGATRLVSVIDSSYLPEEKVRIVITEGGIEDVADE